MKKLTSIIFIASFLPFLVVAQRRFPWEPLTKEDYKIMDSIVKNDEIKRKEAEKGLTNFVGKFDVYINNNELNIEIECCPFLHNTEYDGVSDYMIQSIKQKISFSSKSFIVLNTALSTGIKWGKLNKQYKQSFSKKICSIMVESVSVSGVPFRSVDFTNEKLSILFYGYSDGDFSISFEQSKENNNSLFVNPNFEGISLSNNEVLKIKKELNGYNSNQKKIDDIFK